MARLTTKTAPAVKPAALKTVEKPRRVTRTRAATFPKTFFVIKAVARPFAGVRLYSHTHAALLFTGLLEGKEISRAVLVRLVGNTAIDYHRDEGRVAEADDKVSLTKDGVKFFKDRAGTPKVNGLMVDDFLALFKTGAVTERIQIKPNQVEAVE